MVTKLFYILIFVSTYCHSFSQCEYLSARASLKNDSVFVEIMNNSTSDTMLLTLYLQNKIDSNWVARSDDIFCDNTSPKTTIVFIMPNQIINLSAVLSDANEIDFNNIDISSSKIIFYDSPLSYRVLIKVLENLEGSIKCKAYSNVFY